MSNELSVAVNSQTNMGMDQVGTYANKGMPDAEFLVY